MAPFPRPACLSSREGLTLTPANTRLLARGKGLPVPVLAHWRGDGAAVVRAPPVGGPALTSMPEGRGPQPGALGRCVLKGEHPLIAPHQMQLGNFNWTLARATERCCISKAVAGSNLMNY